MPRWVETNPICPNAHSCAKNSAPVPKAVEREQRCPCCRVTTSTLAPPNKVSTQEREAPCHRAPHLNAGVARLALDMRQSGSKVRPRLIQRMSLESGLDPGNHQGPAIAAVAPGPTCVESAALILLAGVHHVRRPPRDDKHRPEYATPSAISLHLPVRSVYCSGDRPAPSRTSPSMTSFLPTTEQPVHSESGRRRRVSALCKDMGSTY